MFKRSFCLCLFVAGPVIAQPAAEPPQSYAAGQPIPVEFNLQERTREGGRTTPIYGDYRPNVYFDGGSRVECVVAVPGGGVEPGTTRDITLTCPVAVHEGQGLSAFERDRPIGTGIVTAPQ